MKILIIGGTGFIGGATAQRLAAAGHDVTLTGRKPPAPATAMAKFPLLLGDYIAGDFSEEELGRFDAVLFAAGSDIRHVQGEDIDKHWRWANAEATPRFFERIKAAGVKRAVLIGSFYPQAAPELIGKVSYVTARHEADVAVRALAGPDFGICTVNPPYVVGATKGIILPHLAAYFKFALGTLPIPRVAPRGGSNFISVTSLSQAVLGALERGESGKAYLVGDENLTYKEYLERHFRALGVMEPLPLSEEEHPLFPDLSQYAGRGGTIAYEPDEKERIFLGYDRNDIDREIRSYAEDYRALAKLS